jgi:hypothetical protein
MQHVHRKSIAERVWPICRGHQCARNGWKKEIISSFEMRNIDRFKIYRFILSVYNLIFEENNYVHIQFKQYCLKPQ